VAPVLVIGVGSELRADDAAGRHVADAVERIAPPGVEVRSVHQLTPELAVELVGRELVIVVDADVDVEAVTCRTVTGAGGQPGAMTHHLDPGALLGLAALFGPPPGRVSLVSIPVHDLGLGTELSAATAAAAELAVVEVLERCRRALAP
jgi:hydrogenase maturation protease